MGQLSVYIHKNIYNHDVLEMHKNITLTKEILLKVYLVSIENKYIHARENYYTLLKINKLPHLSSGSFLNNVKGELGITIEIVLKSP